MTICVGRSFTNLLPQTKLENWKFAYAWRNELGPMASLYTATKYFNDKNDMAAHTFWTIVFVTTDGQATSAQQPKTTLLLFLSLHFSWLGLVPTNIWANMFVSHSLKIRGAGARKAR